MTKLRSRIAVLAAFVLLAAIITFPQVTRLRTAVADHPDPYLSIWRLGWVAHALSTAPGQLWESNIFYPERSTFAYSDAMLLPAAVLAPLSWLHLNPVLVYNVALLGALALSGFTMFLLALELTGSTEAAFVAGTIYGFAPYRLEQFIHLEMEMVFWIPLALLLIHRLIAAARLREAVLLGVVMAAQFASGMYGAMCFGVCLAVFVPALAIVVPPRRPARLVVLLVIGAAVAGVILLPYALPYMRAQAFAGPRSVREIQHYDAVWSNYLASPSSNRLWGWTTARFGGEELNLFPGAAAACCALAGLVCGRSRTRLAYLAMALFAVEAARGFGGFSYPLLYQYVRPFQALRVPSRFDLLTDASLGVLAAFGVAWILTHVRKDRRRGSGALIVLALVVEYASSPALATVPPASAADKWLASVPPGVVVEVPLPTPGNMWPNDESKGMYLGMASWQPTLNGYSGIFPSSYLELVSVMVTFPDRRSIDYLRERRVDRVLVRGSWYPAGEWERLREALRGSPALSLEAAFPAPGNELVFRINP